MKLLTKEIRSKLPPIRGQEALGEHAVIYCKFFTPDSSWTWYVTEGQPVLDENGREVNFEFFGLVDGFEQEWGYFVLNELEETTGPMGLHIERDLWWKPMPVSEIRKSIDGHPLEPEVEAEVLQTAKDNVMETLLQKEFEVEAEGGEKVTLLVQDTDTAQDIAKYGRWLESGWCRCEKSEFLCYPEDGACSCGIHKHHVHCKKCGGVSQVG